MDSRYIIDIIDNNVNTKVDISKEYSDSEIKQIINECIIQLDKRIPLTKEQKETILIQVYNGRRKLGILQPLLDDTSINEIMVNGTNNIYVERQGRIEEINQRFDSRDKLFNVVQTIVARVNRTVNESNPIVDARLSNGSRINAVLYPVAINGPVVTIRKFSDKPFTIEKLIETKSITLEESEFLKKAVLHRYNIFISGGTSSGKTTLLNVLSSFIPKKERIVTIEDSAELMLNHSNIVRLETRNSNSEGKGEISMRQLIKASLRMRPDRIIVGEVRDESSLDMLNALCTGHDGSMSTGHANSAADMLVRLETMALWEGHVSAEAIRRQISSGIDLVVHLERNERMERKISEITEVCDYVENKIIMNTIYKRGVHLSDLTVKKYKMEGGINEE